MPKPSSIPGTQPLPTALPRGKTHLPSNSPGWHGGQRVSYSLGALSQPHGSVIPIPTSLSPRPAGPGRLSWFVSIPVTHSAQRHPRLQHGRNACPTPSLPCPGRQQGSPEKEAKLLLIPEATIVPLSSGAERGTWEGTGTSQAAWTEMEILN